MISVNILEISAELPGGKGTGPGKFRLFYFSPLSSLNLAVIPGARADDHWDNWTGCRSLSIASGSFIDFRNYV